MKGDVHSRSLSIRLISGNIYFWTHASLIKVFIVFFMNILLTLLFLHHKD